MRAAIALIVFVLAASLACRAAERLDDRASPRQQVHSQLVSPFTLEQRIARYPDASVLVASFGTLDYRLDTSRYVGRTARIYYHVPAAISGLSMPSALLVQWKGLGHFASGAARGGERALVWQGVVKQAQMQEPLEVEARVDGRYLRGKLGFESFFEIEVLK